MSTVAVVGGGISGLAAAYRLRRSLGDEATIVVFEADDRIGGKLHAADLGDGPLDVGAESFLVRRPEVTELASEVGLGGQVVHPTAVRATVRAGGRTLPLPARTLMGIPASPDALGDVVSADAAARIAREPDLGPVPWDGDDAALGPLLRGRLGDEVVDRVVDPLLGGVYAGRADALSIRATVPPLAAALDAGATSLIDAAARALPPSGPADPVFGALLGGLPVLIDRLAELSRAEIRFRCPVRGLRRTEGKWLLDLGASSFNADAVVLAVPAPAASELLHLVAPGAASAFGAVPLASMCVVALALPADTALPVSSGVLIAAGERRADGQAFTVKAFTHSSRKWAHLGSEGRPVLVRGSAGRFGEDDVLERSDEDLISAVCADLADLSGTRIAPRHAIVERWRDALPQYGVGHLKLVAAIRRDVNRLPGLAVCGAFGGGVGIAACIQGATTAAAGVAASVSEGAIA